MIETENGSGLWAEGKGGGGWGGGGLRFRGWVFPFLYSLIGFSFFFFFLILLLFLSSIFFFFFPFLHPSFLFFLARLSLDFYMTSFIFSITPLFY